MIWISKISISGALVTLVLGAISKTLALLFLKILWAKGNSSLGRNLGSLGFMGAWALLEWIQVGVLNYPWMNLGMGLSGMFPWIQWYEYTGTLGGTLWILALNLSAYELLKYSFAQDNPSKIKIRLQFFIWLGLFIIPAIGSIMRFQTYEESRNRHYNRNFHNEAHMVLVQTQISPSEKFDSLHWKGQFEQLLSLSKKSAHSNTEYILWPETALEPWHGLNENHFIENKSILGIRRFLLPYKNASLVTGAITYTTLNPWRSPHPSLDTLWFNTALQLENDENIGLYHKQILVPGVEKSPLEFGNPVRMKGEKISPFMYLGGIRHYFNRDGEPKILYSQSGVGLGTLICFESAFGDYSRKLCIQGAGILAVLTNDSWWGNGPEPYQHRDYSRILAIENRRSVAQASNGGISFLIKPTGEIIKEIPVNVQGSLEGSLDINEELSFYTQYGNWLIFPAMVFFLIAGALILSDKFRQFL